MYSEEHTVLYLAVHSAVPDSAGFVAVAHASVDALLKRRAVGKGFVELLFFLPPVLYIDWEC